MIADPSPHEDDAPPPRELVIDGETFVRMCYAARERLWSRRWTDKDAKEFAK